MKLPDGLKRAKLSPFDKELAWLHDYLKNLDIPRPIKVLEFGCGITSWVIEDALKPDKHVAVEEYQEAMDTVNKYCSNVEIIENWDFPDEDYGLVFVDSSAGSGMAGLNRDKAMIAAESFMREGAIVIMHDWHHGSGSGPRKYAESAGYELITSFSNRRGFGVYRKPNDIVIQSEFSDFKKSKVTVVTACDEAHLWRLELVMPTWIEVKGIDSQIIVFSHGFKPEDTNLTRYENVKFVPWDIDGVRDQRERMLSAFVFGVAEHVETEYFLKLDSDTVALNDHPWFMEDFYEYDMIGQKWGYTKPGQMVSTIDAWMDGLSKSEEIEGYLGTDGSYVLTGDPSKPWRMKHQCKRVISWIRLCKTQIAKDIANVCHYDTMPVPSEDTLVWRWCYKLDLKWGQHKFNSYGWKHMGRPKRQVLEEMCNKALAEAKA
jgi:hypothetical protein